jgi:hypothetical protein
VNEKAVSFSGTRPSFVSGHGTSVFASGKDKISAAATSPQNNFAGGGSGSKTGSKPVGSMSGDGSSVSSPVLSSAAASSQRMDVIKKCKTYRVIIKGKMNVRKEKFPDSAILYSLETGVTIEADEEQVVAHGGNQVRRLHLVSGGWTSFLDSKGMPMLKEIAAAGAAASTSASNVSKGAQVLVGSAPKCTDGIRRYNENGVETSSLGSSDEGKPLAAGRQGSSMFSFLSNSGKSGTSVRDR